MQSYEWRIIPQRSTFLILFSQNYKSSTGL
jgi:hypothetical protein